MQRDQPNAGGGDFRRRSKPETGLPWICPTVRSIYITERTSSGELEFLSEDPVYGVPDGEPRMS